MNSRPIGIFDSGVGGISVLHAMIELMPNEKYIFLADFKNSPYGSKSKLEILDFSFFNMEYLKKRDVKAVVVACNTATSAAIGEIRNEYDFPVIGIEPAIKLASQKISSGKILVLATPATLNFMKFQKLHESFGSENIEKVECPKLVKLIENSGSGSIEIKQYLKDLFAEFNNIDISAVVIGCTHFSFIEDDIKKAVGRARIFDGRYGTARHLKKILSKNNLLSKNKGSIELISNDKNIKYQRLLDDFFNIKLKNKE